MGKTLDVYGLHSLSPISPSPKVQTPMTDVAPGYEASIIWLKFEFSGKIQQFGKYQVPEFDLNILQVCKDNAPEVIVFMIYKLINWAPTCQTYVKD